RITCAHSAHASSDGADQILAAVVHFGGTEQDLFQRSGRANSDPGPAREIRMWSRHTPMITASRRFMGFGKGASHHNGVGPAGERLANIPAFAHPAVGDDRDKAGSFFEIGVARGRAIDGCR